MSVWMLPRAFPIDPLVFHERTHSQYGVAGGPAGLFLVPAAHDDMPPAREDLQSRSGEDVVGLRRIVPCRRELKHLYQRRLGPLFPTISPRASANIGVGARKEAL